jgi:hypothetical protein
MLARQLEKSVNGDEDAQNLVQLLACSGSSRREQVLEYLSNPLNLLEEHNAPHNPTLTAKDGFLWVSKRRRVCQFFFLFQFQPVLDRRWCAC